MINFLFGDHPHSVYYGFFCATFFVTETIPLLETPPCIWNFAMPHILRHNCSIGRHGRPKQKKDTEMY